MKYNISISGPTGAGKTTFTNFFHKRNKIDLISEDIPAELFYKFKTNPYKHCYDLQKTIILTRVENYLRSNNDIKIIDRTVSEDLEVFVAMHNKLGFLSANQVEDLSTISRLAMTNIGEINTIIFIYSDLFCLRRRFKKRSDPKFMANNLKMQLMLYDKWKNKNKNKLIEINNSALPMKQFMKIADLLCRTLDHANSMSFTKQRTTKLLEERINSFQNEILDSCIE